MAEKLYDDICRVAYGLYEKRGRVHGYDLEDWIEAEKIIMERHANEIECEAEAIKTSKEKAKETKPKTRKAAPKTAEKKAKTKEKKVTRKKKTE